MGTLIRLTEFQAEELEYAVERDWASRDWFEITWRGAVPWMTVHYPEQLTLLVHALRDRYCESKKTDVVFVSAYKSMRLLADKVDKELGCLPPDG